MNDCAQRVQLQCKNCCGTRRDDPNVMDVVDYEANNEIIHEVDRIQPVTCEKIETTRSQEMPSVPESSNTGAGFVEAEAETNNAAAAQSAEPSVAAAGAVEEASEPNGPNSIVESKELAANAEVPIETSEPDAAAGAAEDEPTETRLEFAFENLDYDKVMDTPELAESLKTEVLTGIASKLDVPPDHVHVEMSKGSVVVNAIVSPVQGGSAVALKQQIDAAGESFLQAISERVARVPSIKEVVVDPTAGLAATGLKTVLNQATSAGTAGAAAAGAAAAGAAAAGVAVAGVAAGVLSVAGANTGAEAPGESTPDLDYREETFVPIEDNKPKTEAQILQEGEEAIDAQLVDDADPSSPSRALWRMWGASGEQLGASGKSSPTVTTSGIPFETLKKRADVNMRKHACTLWNGEDYQFRDVWTTRKRELAAYGEGVYLYFQLMSLVGLLFLLQLVINGPALITYAIGNMVQDSNKVYQFIAMFTIANLGYCPGGVCRTDEEFRNRPVHDGSTLNVKEWTEGIGILDGIAMFIFIGFIMIYAGDWMWRSKQKVDYEHTTAGDFAIYVRHLPKLLTQDHEKYEEKLKAHFEKRLEDAGVKDCTAIQEISILRQYDGSIQHFKTKGGLLHQKQSIELAKEVAQAQGEHKKEEKALKALNKLAKKIEAVDKKLGNQVTMTQEERQVCGAYIILNRSEYKDELLYQYRLSTSIWYRFKCVHRKRHFEGSPIRVTAACEPSDIIWENADFHPYRRKARRLFTLIVAVGLLMGCTGLLVLLQSVSSNFTKSIVKPKPVWVLQHVASSASRCLNFCGLTMYAAPNCNEQDGHSGTWNISQVFDASGAQDLDVNDDRFNRQFRGIHDLQRWPGLSRKNQSECFNPWRSPACEVSLSGTRLGDWLAIEFSEPQLVQCISVGQHRNQISSSIDVFQCDAGREKVLNSYADFVPEKECVPLKRVYPALRQEEIWVAFSGNMPVKMDVQCQTGSFISLEAARDAKAATEEPEKDPIVGCYCSTKVLEVGISFRIPPYETEEERLCEEWSSSENTKLAKMVGVVAVVLILNNVLTYSFEYLIIWERHGSQVDTTTSRQWKLLCAQFVNTGVLYLIVNANLQGEFDWFPFVEVLKIGQGDFVDFRPAWFIAVGSSIFTTVSFLIVSTPVPTILMSFVVNPIMIRIFSVGLMTQETLNAVYQLPAWDLSLKLAQSLTVIFVVITYAGGMPALYLIGFLYCVVTYWVEKWILLRGSRKPPKYSYRPIQRGLYLIPVAVFFHVFITLWMYGNQKLFPSEWSVIRKTLEAIIGLTREEYVEIIRDFENGTDEDQKRLFDRYLHARLLDFARISCWFLTILFSVLLVVFVLLFLFFFVLRPLLTPCETVVRGRIKKMRHQGIGRLKGKPFEELKDKMIAEGHETSYLLAYNPSYQDAYVGMTGELGSAPELKNLDATHRVSVTPGDNRPVPPGVCADPLTHVMLVLSVAAGVLIILAIVWNDM